MSLPPLPVQPADVSWPTPDWPEGPPSAGTDTARLAALIDGAFDETARADIAKIHAVLAVQHGRVVLERYAEGQDADTIQPSWSMAKSITQALVGMLVMDGRIDIHAPAWVPEWQQPGDPRGAITLDQLLRMSSGLQFVEAYVPGQPSDVIEMLFGAGKGDVAGFAAGLPLAHPPGTYWSYASGTTNIIARAAAHACGGDLGAYMRRRLFEPLGMQTPVPRFDESGTFIGSSFCNMTPRDFARFGLLYLRDGVWDGRRLLPEGWVDYARTPTPQTPDAGDDRYGAHWWLDYAAPRSFSANGYAGQFIVVVPEKDLILVRNGNSPEAAKEPLRAWLGEVLACFG